MSQIYRHRIWVECHGILEYLGFLGFCSAHSPQARVVTKSVGVGSLLAVDLEGKSLRVLVLLRPVVPGPGLDCSLQSSLVMVVSHPTVMQTLPSQAVSGLRPPHPPPSLVCGAPATSRRRRS